MCHSLSARNICRATAIGHLSQWSCALWMPPTPLSSLTRICASCPLERAFALGSSACLLRSSPAACSTFPSPRRYSATWPIPAASPQTLLRATARIQLPLRYHSLQCRIATISQYDTATLFGKSSLRLVTHSAAARLPRSFACFFQCFCALFSCWCWFVLFWFLGFGFACFCLFCCSVCCFCVVGCGARFCCFSRLNDSDDSARPD